MGKDIFATIGEASATGGGDWIRDGRYEFILKEMKLDELYHGQTFVAELYVKASASIGAVGDDGKPVVPNAAGTTVAYIQQMKFPSAPGNIKGFIEKLLGKSYGKEDTGVAELRKDMQKLLGASNPGRGYAINAETYRKPIQKGANAGKLLTLPRWSTVNMTKESVAANRGVLDAAPVDNAAEDEGAEEAGAEA